MAKFTAKPPTFDALQFTGGEANARTIIEGVAALSTAFVVRFLPPASEFGLEGGVVKEFKSTQRLKVQEVGPMTDTYVNVGDWVVVNRNGYVSVLNNADFGAVYQAQ